MALDIDQTKFLEEAMRKVKEQAFYMKHAMVSLSLANELPAFYALWQGRRHVCLCSVCGFDGMCE